jgi:mannonate dehydratase
MNRRQLFHMTAAAAASQAINTKDRAEAATPKKALMKLGMPERPHDRRAPAVLQASQRKQHLRDTPEDAGNKGYSTVEELTKLKERCEKHEISLDCIAPPFLASSHIDRTPRPAIMLGQSPERDRDIEAIQTLIRNCAKVGIPSIKYNMSLLGVLRTDRTPGRAGRASRRGGWRKPRRAASSHPKRKRGR